MYVALSGEENRELDTLAQHYRLTRPQIVRNLLRAEYARHAKRKGLVA